MKLGQRRAMDIESVSTGSLSLDVALGIGGLPKGRVVEVYGPESSGKTTLALQVVSRSSKSWWNMCIYRCRACFRSSLCKKTWCRY